MSTPNHATTEASTAGKYSACLFAPLAAAAAHALGMLSSSPAETPEPETLESSSEPDTDPLAATATTTAPATAPCVPLRVRKAPASRKKVFLVERIIAKKRVATPRSRWSYLVKWAGYPDSENTWEPYKHVRNLEAYAEFMRRD